MGLTAGAARRNQLPHVRFPVPGGVRVGRGQAGLHFADRDHRQEADEDQEERREQAEPARELNIIARGGVEHLPARRQEITVQG